MLTFAFFTTLIPCTSLADKGGVPHNAQQPLTLESLETMPLNCTFQATTTTVLTNPSTATVTTVTAGNPPKIQTYTHVTVTTDFPPYGSNGVTFLAFGDAALFSASLVTTYTDHDDNDGAGNGKDHGKDMGKDGGKGKGNGAQPIPVQSIVATWNTESTVLNTGTCSVVGNP